MKDLQPWIDYQAMLDQYVRRGYMEVSPKKNEAYITEAAFCTLCSGIPTYHILDFRSDIAAAGRALREMLRVVRFIRTYALVIGTHEEAYRAYTEAAMEHQKHGTGLTAPEAAVVKQEEKTGRNFALHIVDDRSPHDLHFTLLVSRRRRWWCPWTKHEHMEVIPYI